MSPGGNQKSGGGNQKVLARQPTRQPMRQRFSPSCGPEPNSPRSPSITTPSDPSHSTPSSTSSRSSRNTLAARQTRGRPARGPRISPDPRLTGHSPFSCCSSPSDCSSRSLGWWQHLEGDHVIGRSGSKRGHRPFKRCGSGSATLWRGVHPRGRAERAGRQ